MTITNAQPLNPELVPNPTLPIKIRVAYFRRLKSGSLRTIVYWRAVKATSARIAGRKLVRHSVRIGDTFQAFLTLPECVTAIQSAIKGEFQRKAATGMGGGFPGQAGIFECNRFGF